MDAIITKKEFIRLAKLVHGDKYSYEKVGPIVCLEKGDIDATLFHAKILKKWDAKFQGGFNEDFTNLDQDTQSEIQIYFEITKGMK